jgi:hypothetical protein
MTSRTIIQRGRWLYDGTVHMPATIVALDYDFWYEIGRADGDLEPGETPALNAEGRLYYVCFKSDPAAHPGWVDSQGFRDVAAARTCAERQVPSPIEWSAPAAI